MMETLLLFDSVVNSRWFNNTQIFVFLNKVDKLRVKLARNPMADYFPDYKGGNDANRAAKYILWRLNQVNRAGLDLYPHLTRSNDPANMKVVFQQVKDAMAKKATEKKDL